MAEVCPHLAPNGEEQQDYKEEQRGCQDRSNKLSEDAKKHDR